MHAICMECMACFLTGGRGGGWLLYDCAVPLMATVKTRWKKKIPTGWKGHSRISFQCQCSPTSPDVPLTLPGGTTSPDEALQIYRHWWNQNI